MNDFIICLDKNNQVICWGDMFICSKYINQSSTISEENVIYEEYSISDRYSYLYEDYEVYNVEGTNIYLTLGEIKLIRSGCQEEIKGVKYIKEELGQLKALTNIFNKSILEEIEYFEEFMDDVYNVLARYNSNNLFTNLDVDALRMSHQIERENTGLPIIFIK